MRCYQAKENDCTSCSRCSICFDKTDIRRRILASSCYPAFFRGHSRAGTAEYMHMMRLRKIWAEGSFSAMKREHYLSKIRKRGISAVTEECLLSAMALNLKRMVKAIFSTLYFFQTKAGFKIPRSWFSFCQQVLYCTLPPPDQFLRRGRTIDQIQMEHNSIYCGCQFINYNFLISVACGYKLL